MKKGRKPGLLDSPFERSEVSITLANHVGHELRTDGMGWFAKTACHESREAAVTI